jgi:hypothetical protein
MEDFLNANLLPPKRTHEQEHTTPPSQLALVLDKLMHILWTDEHRNTWNSVCLNPSDAFPSIYEELSESEILEVVRIAADDALRTFALEHCNIHFDEVRAFKPSSKREEKNGTLFVFFGRSKSPPCTLRDHALYLTVREAQMQDPTNNEHGMSGVGTGFHDLALKHYAGWGTASGSAGRGRAFTAGLEEIIVAGLKYDRLATEEALKRTAFPIVMDLLAGELEEHRSGRMDLDSAPDDEITDTRTAHELLVHELFKVVGGDYMDKEVLERIERNEVKEGDDITWETATSLSHTELFAMLTRLVCTSGVWTKLHRVSVAPQDDKDLAAPDKEAAVKKAQRSLEISSERDRMKRVKRMKAAVIASLIQKAREPKSSTMLSLILGVMNFLGGATRTVGDLHTRLGFTNGHDKAARVCAKLEKSYIMKVLPRLHRDLTGSLRSDGKLRVATASADNHNLKGKMYRPKKDDGVITCVDTSCMRVEPHEELLDPPPLGEDTARWHVEHFTVEEVMNYTDVRIGTLKIDDPFGFLLRVLVSTATIPGYEFAASDNIPLCTSFYSGLGMGFPFPQLVPHHFGTFIQFLALMSTFAVFFVGTSMVLGTLGAIFSPMDYQGAYALAKMSYQVSKGLLVVTPALRLMLSIWVQTIAPFHLQKALLEGLCYNLLDLKNWTSHLLAFYGETKFAKAGKKGRATLVKVVSNAVTKPQLVGLLNGVSTDPKIGGMKKGDLIATWMTFMVQALDKMELNKITVSDMPTSPDVTLLENNVAQLPTATLRKLVEDVLEEPLISSVIESNPTALVHLWFDALVNINIANKKEDAAAAEAGSVTSPPEDDGADVSLNNEDFVAFVLPGGVEAPMLENRSTLIGAFSDAVNAEGDDRVELLEDCQQKLEALLQRERKKKGGGRDELLEQLLVASSSWLLKLGAGSKKKKKTATDKHGDDKKDDDKKDGEDEAEDGKSSDDETEADRDNSIARVGQFVKVLYEDEGWSYGVVRSATEDQVEILFCVDESLEILQDYRDADDIAFVDQTEYLKNGGDPKECGPSPPPQGPEEGIIMEVLDKLKGQDGISYTRLETIMTQWYLAFAAVRAELISLTKAKYSTEWDEEKDDNFNLHTICSRYPSIGAFWRFFDCDLTLSVLPFRELHGGNIKPLLDALLPMALHLCYYKKNNIAGTVIVFLDTCIQLFNRKKRVFDHMCKTARICLCDLMQELQNAMLASITNSAAFRSAEYIKQRSILSPFLSQLRALARRLCENKAKKEGRTIPEEEEDVADLEGVVPEEKTDPLRHPHELQVRFERATGKKFESTQTDLRSWVIDSYGDILQGKDEYKNMKAVNKEKFGYGPFVSEVIHQFALISSAGFDKPPRKMKSDYVYEYGKHKEWFEKELADNVQFPMKSEGELKKLKINEWEALLADVERAGVDSAKSVQFKVHLKAMFESRVRMVAEKKAVAAAKRAATKKEKSKKKKNETKKDD